LFAKAYVFISLCVILFIVSWLKDKKKTIAGVKKGIMMFRNIAVPFVNILALISIFLYFIPPHVIVHYLGGQSGFVGISIAAIVGSITLIPAFISYPIAGTLVRAGASYAVVATFMTTLMMVGVVTFPLEARYFGKKVAFVRNVLNFFAAIAIGIVVGWML
jgi:uncharacterized membrane protein YraQ (UPF0718 family)